MFTNCGHVFFSLAFYRTEMASGRRSPISGRKIVRNAITRESYVRDITALLGDKKGIAQRTVDLIAKTSIGFDAAKQAQVEAAVV